MEIVTFHAKHVAKKVNRRTDGHLEVLSSFGNENSLWGNSKVCLILQLTLELIHYCYTSLERHPWRLVTSKNKIKCNQSNKVMIRKTWALKS